MLNGVDPGAFRWTDMVKRLREAHPDMPMTIWCNEDTPLIWAQVVREMAGLDPIAATEFDELITYLHENLDLTILMITHDVDSLFNTCDRIAVLVDRQVRVDTPEHIVADPHPWIREYFGAPRARRAWAGRERHRAR